MRKTVILGAFLVLVLLGFQPGTEASAAETKIEIAKLTVQPSSIVLAAPGEGRHVLVTGERADGNRIDLTSDAQFEPLSDGVRVDEAGFLYPLKEGETRVRVTAAGHTTELIVKVSGLGHARSLNFLRDVAPLLNKVGCTAGACHGSAKGKNGFKLSLRGYDPEFDYNALLYELSGRRINRAAAEQSLMVAKPTQSVPHEGGLQIKPGSRYHKTILGWISGGVKLGDPGNDGVVRIEVLPQEIFMTRPGMKQHVLVTAYHADGSLRDVTREAVIKSNSNTTVTVTDDLVEGQRTGEANLMVRYQGKFVTLPVTILNPEPGFRWDQLSLHNYIDEQVDTKLKRLKIQPSPVADDTAFLRRVYLDLIGLPPTPEEARAFLEDPEKSRLKRGRLIDQLMSRREFVDHWALKWGDLLQSNRKYLGEKGTWAFRQWIRDSIASNQPYDEMVRELVTATGSTYQNPAANFFRVNDDPKVAMQNTTQIFMGVRMVCAQCHDHPFEKWTQTQYYQLAAFFAAVGVRPGFDSDEQIVYLKREENEIKHPKTGRVVDPRYIVASVGAPPIPDEGDRRQALAEWLTSDKNPFFARAIVNRLWSYFFGRGIIEPVDDIRASNPPVNEALLQALADDFIEHDYDLQHVIRTIVRSRAYQTGIETNKWNENDATNFSHFIPRRLPAETLFDAISIATGSNPEFPEVPSGFTAQQLPDPHVGKGGFLDMFGRPERESACECERRNNMTLPQAMNLVNGPTLAEAIADPDGRVATLILAGESNRRLIDELYLATLSRFPTNSEYDDALTYLEKGPGRASRAQDMLWALINSNAFLFNR